MLEPLTEREQEILLLLSQGRTNREIAIELYLSQGTVKAHNHNIFSKLGVSTRTQALLRAQELGLLEERSLPDTPRAPASDDQWAESLPVQLMPFFGRQTELGKLAELLVDARVRLITIVGIGGTGKTRLAIEAARQQIGHFPDGVLFVPLASTLETRNVAAAILDVLGLSLQATDNLATQLFAYLFDKRMLLILDNYEHLLDGASFITELLQAAAQVKVLVTSRERLQLTMEVLYVLGGLDYDATPNMVDPLAYSAAQLLVQRAQFVNPGFELHLNDWDSVRRICELTEGMPLALILAAGWLDMLTLEEIAAELAHSIDILASQLRDLPTRQRSMRVTIAASWNRLSRDEQRIFASLSVFRGGFTREAMLQVTGAGLRELQTLVNRSFITVSERRYELHELLRQFGNSELQQSSYAVGVYAAHSAYYLDFLRQREADVKGRRQRAALAEIQADFENVRAAWEWAVVRRDFDGIGQVLECLTNFAEMRVYLVQIENIFRRAVASLAPTGAETPHPVWDQIALRHIQAKHRLSLSGDMELLEAFLERARARSDAHEIAYVRWVMGNQALREHNYSLHDIALGESLVIWRQLGDEFYLGHALIGITGEDMSPEASESSLRSLHESAAIRRRLGDHHNLSFSLSMIGFFLAYRGDFAESEAALEECLALQDNQNRTPDFAGVVSLKGMIAFWRGDLEAAVQLAELGLDFCQDMNYYGDKSYCLVLLGLVISLRGDYQHAAELCQQASQDELFNTMAVAVYWGLALVRCGLGDDRAAWQSLTTTLNIASVNLKSVVFQIVCLPVAAVLLARAGEKVQAAELLALAFSQPSGMTGWMHQWSLLVMLRRDLESALGAEDFAAAWRHGESLELPFAIAQVLHSANP